MAQPQSQLDLKVAPTSALEIERSDMKNLESNSPMSAEARTEMLVAEVPKRKWQSYIWDSFDKSPEERRFIFKLDSALITMACLGYFIKYLDQSNINNAFVSGMKEDLSLYGNQLNYMQTCYSVGYVFGGLPTNLLLTRIRPSLFIPCVEIVWSVLTMVSCKCNTAQQLYVIRFFVGLFESALFPGMIYIIGSWYRSDELAKRTCIFQMMSAVGPMFSGYLAAAVYRLEGVGGFHGWQWLFIVDGIISIPISIAGFFFLPDVPENTRAWYFTADEVLLAKKRMETEGRANRAPFTVAKFKKIFSTWHWFCLVPLYVVWNNGSSGAQPVFQQFLKSSTNPVYPVQQINIYPTITGGVQVFCTLVFAWTSDSVLKGRRYPALLIGATFNIVSYASLWYWDIPNGWRWASYCLGGVGGSVAGIAMSWAHEICTADMEERALVTGSMNQLAYVFQIWVPLLAWQQIEQPKYTKGFALATILNVALVIMTLITLYFFKRDQARKIAIPECTNSSEKTEELKS